MEHPTYDQIWKQTYKECLDKFTTRAGKDGEEIHFTTRMDPNRELDSRLVELLHRTGKGPYYILDVGAGPITSLGTKINGKPIDIWAVDKFAGAWNKGLDELGLVPPVRTMEGAGETLHLCSPDHFHLVTAINSLDHTDDPYMVIQKMLHVTKPGGFVYIYVYENEGVHNQYRDQHHWNFYGQKDHDLILWNPWINLNVTRAFQHQAITETERIARVDSTNEKLGMQFGRMTLHITMEKLA